MHLTVGVRIRFRKNVGLGVVGEGGSPQAGLQKSASWFRWAGTANTGQGGGTDRDGPGGSQADVGGAGGSGVVIISYDRNKVADSTSTLAYRIN